MGRGCVKTLGPDAEGDGCAGCAQHGWKVLNAVTPHLWCMLRPTRTCCNHQPTQTLSQNHTRHEAVPAQHSTPINPPKTPLTDEQAVKHKHLPEPALVFAAVAPRPNALALGHEKVLVPISGVYWVGWLCVEEGVGGSAGCVIRSNELLHAGC